MKVRIGVSRRRHTFSSLMVRASTPLTRVDHHHRRIDRGQRAIGVFGEVLVARRVEQVDHAVAVGKLHHRAGHRDAALLFQFHPVGGGVAAGLARPHFARHLDGAAEPQQLFGERGLAGIRVGNDGEGAAAGDFEFELGHGGRESNAKGRDYTVPTPKFPRGRTALPQVIRRAGVRPALAPERPLRRAPGPARRRAAVP